VASDRQQNFEFLIVLSIRGNFDEFKIGRAA
jgi:hypothetical protein